MGKAIRNYLIILGLLVVIMAMTVFSSQKKSWAKSYDVAQKDPYGLYILSEEIDAFFDKKVIKIADDLPEWMENTINNNYKVLKYRL